MKNIAMTAVVACIALGSAQASASASSKQVCERFSDSINPNNYPQMVDKETVKQAPSAEYREATGECVITVNYDFKFSKFVTKVKDMAQVIERNPERVVELYLKSGQGERALRQVIKEEYRSKYEGLAKDDIHVYMNARFTGLDEGGVDSQYFDLHKK